MKHILLSLLLFIGTTWVMAQSGSARQVNWNFSSKKIAANTYEVVMTATIKGDFHLYSQDAGGEGPVATTINFTKNPLLTIDGKAKENGKLVRKYEEAWKHNVNYYEKSVSFVQVVKVKGKAKTNVAGKVEFMVCNDELCLPPSEVEFKIAVGG